MKASFKGDCDCCETQSVQVKSFDAAVGMHFNGKTMDLCIYCANTQVTGRFYPHNYDDPSYRLMVHVNRVANLLQKQLNMNEGKW